MSELRLDRLTLRLSGISPGDARRLAALVADRLAGEHFAPSLRARERVRLSLEARPGETLESTAGRIAAELAAATRGA